MVTRKNVAAMKPDEALSLLNYIPYADRVELRGGSALHGNLASGASTLMSYASGADEVMLAASGGKIFDVTDGGDLTASAPLKSGYTNDLWQSVNFGTAGGQFLLGVNGADKPFIYNGTTVEDSGINPPSGSVNDYIHVTAHQQRLFLIPKGKLAFDYLPVSSIAGDASRFELGPYCKLGGYLMAMASWTVDAGNGVNDMAVLITSKGEVIVYSGSFPGSADDWSLVGTFRCAPPVGRRCFVNRGGDVIINTFAGPISLKDVLAGRDVNESKSTLYNIQPTFKDATAAFGDLPGWEAVYYPEQGVTLFNVPATGTGLYNQHVFVSESSGWCIFGGWNATCFVVHDKELYFADATGNIFKALSGTTDNGMSIKGDIELAFDYLGNASEKHIALVRPVWRSTTDLTVDMVVNTDFTRQAPTYQLTNIGEGTDWEDLDWATWEWDNSTDFIFQPWENAAAEGRCASLFLRTETKNLIAALFSIDYVVEDGGMV